MTATGLARRLVGQRPKLVRVSSTVAVLASGLWLGTAALSPPAAMAICQISTNVTGRIHNETDTLLFLSRASHGITNTWCVSPPSPVSPNSDPTKDYFEAGDNVFDTEVTAVYVAPNRNIISLSAASQFDTYDGSCSVSAPDGTTIAYQCLASVSHNYDEGGKNTVADFYITPKRTRTPGAEAQVLTISPSKTNPGKTVTVSGSVGNGCQTGHKGDAAIVYSKAFKGVTKRSFRGVPSVSASLSKTKNGSFSFKMKLSKKLRTGTYSVNGRCGGGKFGSATLKVTKRVTPRPSVTG